MINEFVRMTHAALYFEGYIARARPARSLRVTRVNASLFAIVRAPSRLQAATHHGPASSSWHISQVIVCPVYGLAAGLPTGQILTHALQPIHTSVSVTTVPLACLTRAFMGHTLMHGAFSQAMQIIGTLSAWDSSRRILTLESCGLIML